MDVKSKPVTHTQINQIMDELSYNHLERKDAIHCLVLALLTGEHAFLLGPPGTSKSLLCRDLADRIVGASYFEALLSRTRPVEAVLGPLDLPLLRDTGAYRRKVDGYLPTADIAFLDEVGNFSPTLGHDLHAILNERRLHEVNEKGASFSEVPLYTCWTAGNTVPGEDSDDAAALWDRLLLRAKVDNIHSDGEFIKLFDLMLEGNPMMVDWDSLKKVIDNEIPDIPIAPKVLDAMVLVRTKLREHADPANPEGIQFSDRRWKKAGRVLQAQAWLKGKDMVTEIDLLALKFVLWDEPSQMDISERLLISVADRVSDQIRTLRDNIQDLDKGIKSRKGHSKEQRSEHATHTLRKAKAIRQELIRINAEHPNHDEVKVTVKQFKNMWETMFKVLLDQEPVDFDVWWKQVN